MDNESTSNAPDTQFVLHAADLLEQQIGRLAGQAEPQTVQEVTKIVAQITADIRLAATGQEAPTVQGATSGGGTPLCSSCYTTYKRCVANGRTDCAANYNYCIGHCVV